MEERFGSCAGFRRAKYQSRLGEPVTFQVRVIVIELLQITPAVDIEQETSVGGGVNNPSAAAFSAAAFASASCLAFSSAAALISAILCFSFTVMDLSFKEILSSHCQPQES